GKTRRTEDHIVYESVEGGMLSERARFAVGETRYEVAGLWSNERAQHYRSQFESILRSVRPIQCDSPVQFRIPVLRVVQSENGVEKSVVPEVIEAAPAFCEKP
ncbi:MAG: hypothetical protein AAF658_16965, partial [Myxococcota bacterium]